ncbi:MAG TPA: patatin-like phospholipase family protein [Baekduia sp.]
MTGARVTPLFGRTRTRSRGPRTAFVLSGGASLGALQAGMLHALYEAEIRPDLLVATSAGAINAAFAASRAQTVETAEALASLWGDVRRGDVFPVSPWVLAGGMLGRRDHVVSPGALRKLLKRHIEFDDLADATIPLHIVAYDLDARTEILLSEGPTADAVVAASAVPGVFPPVNLGGRRLVDGGVANNTPISQAVALGAQRVYVLPTQNCTAAHPLPTRGALNAAIDGLGVMMRSRLEADIERFSHQAELIVLPAPNTGDVLPTDFGQAPRLVADALAAARLRLAQAIAA